MSYLFIARAARLTAGERAVLTQVQERVPELANVYALSQGFVQLVRQQAGQDAVRVAGASLGERDPRPAKLREGNWQRPSGDCGGLNAALE
jgi:hypothetical protein